MKEIDNKEEFEEIIKTMGKLVVVEFGASWCGPCRMITPFFNKLEEEPGVGEHVLFAKVDVDEVEELAEDCEISCMPTFLVFKDGVRVDELKGANREKLQAVIEKYLPCQQQKSA